MLASANLPLSVLRARERILPLNAYPLEALRRDYQALHQTTYLNTGTVGIMSETVLQKHLERIARYERTGHAGEADAREGYEAARSAFASLINAAPGEIALTRNASDGVNYVLSGLDIPEKATILTTSEEHPAVLLPAAMAMRDNGGSLRMFDISDHDDDALANLRNLLNSQQVYLAVISHVSCETGKRLPIVDMCRMCREHGVLTLVDGAQSVGQFDVDVQDIGCDFMTGNGHKWLCGPKGTGFLYVRQDRIESLSPRYIGDGSVDPRFDRNEFIDGAIGDAWGFRTDAQRFEFGTRNWHLYGAIPDAIHQLESLGWNNIYRHVDEMSTLLKKELQARSSIRLHTPAEWDASCGLVTFSVDGWDGTELSERLWNDHGIIQRRVQIPSGVRISCAHYTSEEDLRTFLSALDNTIKG